MLPIISDRSISTILCALATMQHEFKNNEVLMQYAQVAKEEIQAYSCARIKGGQ